MEVKKGSGTTKFGPGVEIQLSGDEVTAAIITYLVAHNVHCFGPRTITVNGELCKDGKVYVDPSGFVMADGERHEGRGENNYSW